MKYLLIDFGASYIKHAVFDKTADIIYNINNIISPFQTNASINKIELKTILTDIISSNSDINGVIICTILGGSWVNDIYYSWKSDKIHTKNYCLVSGLFNSKIIHDHHKDFTDSNEYTSKLIIIGYINDTPIFSPLGDTNCVIESLPLTDKNVAINIGTGSQVIYKRNNNIITHKYIPAGRMFLVFNELFKSLKLDFFSCLSELKIQDVIDSSLTIDLNVFTQSHHYNGGGSISNINEGNFNITNIVGSIFKEFIIQYKEYINDIIPEQLLIVGGISKKNVILKELFNYYYRDIEILMLEDSIESTYKGMIQIIKKDLS
jgi:hypothetical protein